LKGRAAAAPKISDRLRQQGPIARAADERLMRVDFLDRFPLGFRTGLGSTVGIELADVPRFALVRGCSVISVSPSPVHVMCVDDNRDAVESLAMILRLVGLNVSVYYDAPSAIEAAARSYPDVCVSDISMPGVSGYELARQLRAATAGRPLYLIALTARTSDEDRQRSYEAGFDLHLNKPADPMDLITTVRTHGERVAARRMTEAPPLLERAWFRTA
jgi:CheY-like chemotaxis protein